VLPIENEALADLCAKIDRGASASMGLGNLSLDDDQRVLGGSRLTDSVDLKELERFYKSGKGPPAKAVKQAKRKSAATQKKSPKASAFGEMNNIVARMLTNLTSSMRFEGSLNVDLNEITTNLVPFPKLHFLLSSMSPVFATADPRQQPRRLNQMFAEAFQRSVTSCLELLR